MTILAVFHAGGFSKRMAVGLVATSCAASARMIGPIVSQDATSTASATVCGNGLQRYFSSQKTVNRRRALVDGRA
jgi:hypothetical protein